MVALVETVLSFRDAGKRKRLTQSHGSIFGHDEWEYVVEVDNKEERTMVKQV